MDLDIKDIVQLLGISKEEVYELVREKRIPCYRINNRYRFAVSEIREWVLKNHVSVTDKILNLERENRASISLVSLLRRGGLHYGVGGATVAEVIRNAVDLIALPQGMKKDDVVSHLIQREAMMPTAIGRGLAIPHPRTPIITRIEDESLALCFLKNDIDYKAIDGTLVRTIFVLLSAQPSRHLEILSKISFLCQQDEFVTLLDRRAQSEDILSHVEKKEKEWETLHPAR